MTSPASIGDALYLYRRSSFSEAAAGIHWGVVKLLIYYHPVVLMAGAPHGRLGPLHYERSGLLPLALARRARGWANTAVWGGICPQTLPGASDCTSKHASVVGLSDTFCSIALWREARKRTPPTGAVHRNLQQGMLLLGCTLMHSGLRSDLLGSRDTFIQSTAKAEGRLPALACWPS